MNRGDGCGRPVATHAQPLKNGESAEHLGMKKGLVFLLIGLGLGGVAEGLRGPTARAQCIESVWTNPPIEARLRAYWWWLNGNVTTGAITRDLEEMKDKGFGGAVIMDAGGAEQNGNAPVPHGPDFLSPEWMRLFRHALAEAHRLGLELSLNIQSGWNLGGPMVSPDDAVKKLTWAATNVQGGTRISLKLPMPPANDGYYRDVCVLAWPLKNSPAERRPLRHQRVKALLDRPSFAGPHAWFLANSAPLTAPFLLEEDPDTPGEEDTTLDQILNLTDWVRTVDGRTVLDWVAPTGTWHVLRIGFTLGDWRRVSTHSDGWAGYAIDVLDKGAFLRYWAAVVDPLLAEARPYLGKTLKYLHTDSWETEHFNWTTSMPAEFRVRCGYDLIRWLPVVAGYIVNSRSESTRFLEDLRRTLGDLAADNHYRVFAELAHRHGLQIHPESGGPHFTPIDAQQCLGINDVPMSEFWAMARTHRSLDQTRFFVKQPASAAHTMGKRIVAAEGFTTVGPHWQERIWDNLKPSFDQALCEGLNLLVWHAVVCSPPAMGLPGQQYFAGTHFNPNTTWWPKSKPFLDYINRCQALLQHGLFVADVCYYYGDHVPNYAQAKQTDPAGVLPGYDYDVISAEALLSRLSVQQGRLVLPDGMTYEVLVLPGHKQISLPVLRKIRELVLAGATVVGQRPVRASGLADRVRADAEVQRLADELWGTLTQTGAVDRVVGRGRVVSGKPVRTVLAERGIKPDLEVRRAEHPAAIDYVHRRSHGIDIYFIANKTNIAQEVELIFRVDGRVPEFWDPLTGEQWVATSYKPEDGRTWVPMQLGPYGSMFVVFRKPASEHPPSGGPNFPRFRPVKTLPGPWDVWFDPTRGGPGLVRFNELMDWTAHSEPGIRYYSGSAIYRKEFDLTPEESSSGRLWLTLGSVRELAEVRLNGRTCGVVWYPPFRVEITGAVRPGTNLLEIEVVNFWPNRIIGDQFLPPESRFTRTNIRRLTRETALMDSGLFGPIVLETRGD